MTGSAAVIPFGLSLFFSQFRSSSGPGDTSANRELMMSNTAAQNTIRLQVRPRTPPPTPWVSDEDRRAAIAKDDERLLSVISEHDPEKQARDQATACKMESITAFKDTVKFRQDKQAKIDRVQAVGTFLRSVAESKKGTVAVRGGNDNNEDDDEEEGEDILVDNPVSALASVGRKKTLAGERLRRVKSGGGGAGGTKKKTKSLMPRRDVSHIRNAQTPQTQLRIAAALSRSASE